MWRPGADDGGGVDHFDYNGDALRRQGGADDDYGGGEQKDDRRDSKQEHVSQRVEQGPLGAAGEGKEFCERFAPAHAREGGGDVRSVNEKAYVRTEVS